MGDYCTSLSRAKNIPAIDILKNPWNRGCAHQLSYVHLHKISLGASQIAARPSDRDQIDRGDYFSIIVARLGSSLLPPSSRSCYGKLNDDEPAKGTPALIVGRTNLRLIKHGRVPYWNWSTSSGSGWRDRSLDWPSREPSLFLFLSLRHLSLSLPARGVRV